MTRPRTRARSADGIRTTRALLLKRVEYGDADLVITLLTETHGKLSALARGARRSTRRFGGALEPMHTLEVALEERTHGDLFGLRDAKIERPRLALISDLARLEAAGRALSWVRQAAPARTPEPELFRVIEGVLDRLAGPEPVDARATLAAAGLSLLTVLGWGVDFERCVSCGKECPPDLPGLVDPTRGGLLCRSCGGARLRLAADRRRRLGRAAATGDPGELGEGDAEVALDLVEHVLRTHAGLS